MWTSTSKIPNYHEDPIELWELESTQVAQVEKHYGRLTQPQGQQGQHNFEFVPTLKIKQTTVTKQSLSSRLESLEMRHLDAE